MPFSNGFGAVSGQKSLKKTRTTGTWADLADQGCPPKRQPFSTYLPNILEETVQAVYRDKF